MKTKDFIDDYSDGFSDVGNDFMNGDSMVEASDDDFILEDSLDDVGVFLWCKLYINFDNYHQQVRTKHIILGASRKSRRTAS